MLLSERPIELGEVESQMVDSRRPGLSTIVVGSRRAIALRKS
jgi:hypothetical protein